MKISVCIENVRTIEMNIDFIFAGSIQTGLLYDSRISIARMATHRTNMHHIGIHIDIFIAGSVGIGSNSLAIENSATI